MKLITSLIVVCLLFTGVEQSTTYSGTLTQTNSSQGPVRPTNCEYNVSVLTAAHQEAGDGGSIRVVAHLGTREKRRDLNRRRLHNVRTFLTEFGGRDPKSIITREGKRVDGYARVNLYIGGNLFHTFMVRRDDDLRVGVCVYEEQEGPCADERQRKLYPCLAASKR